MEGHARLGRRNVAADSFTIFTVDMTLSKGKADKFSTLFDQDWKNGALINFSIMICPKYFYYAI